MDSFLSASTYAHRGTRIEARIRGVWKAHRAFGPICMPLAFALLPTALAQVPTNKPNLFFVLVSAISMLAYENACHLQVIYNSRLTTTAGPTVCELYLRSSCFVSYLLFTLQLAGITMSKPRDKKRCRRQTWNLLYRKASNSISITFSSSVSNIYPYTSAKVHSIYEQL